MAASSAGSATSRDRMIRRHRALTRPALQRPVSLPALHDGAGFSAVLDDGRRTAARIKAFDNEAGPSLRRPTLDSPSSTKKIIPSITYKLNTGDPLCGLHVGDKVVLAGKMGLGGDIGIVLGGGDFVGMITVEFSDSDQSSYVQNVNASSLHVLTEDEIDHMENKIREEQLAIKKKMERIFKHASHRRKTIG